MNFSIMLLSVFLTSFGYAQEMNCYTNLNQDMNCNTIDVQEEGVVDLLHPECDPEFPLQDYYFDYTSFGCLIPTYDMDEDGDGYEVGDDCNDNDNSIYPGAEETPEDGIDSNCNNDDDT